MQAKLQQVTPKCKPQSKNGNGMFENYSYKELKIQ